MKYAFFKGCKIPSNLEHYGTGTKKIIEKFGIRLVNLDFNCCGYPNRDISFESFVLSSARNIARAGKKGLPIMTPCKCCYGNLKHANYFLKENEKLRKRINGHLEKENLIWTGTTEIKHLLSVLYDDVGPGAIKLQIVNPQSGLKVAAHYGCHALRPSAVVHFDNPRAPSIFEELIEATGAKTVEWPRRLDCCGNPLWEKNNDLSLNLMNMKLLDARDSGADCICTACTYCQFQFDTVQYSEMNDGHFPAVLFTQLLGLALGIPERHLGLRKNAVPCEEIC